ncbi:hypothetical protein [Bacillus thuringiensis]|nr:hypothetical protein [Bacillus thuringiensis]
MYHYEMMYDATPVLVRIEHEMNWKIVYELLEPFYTSALGAPDN